MVESLGELVKFYPKIKYNQTELEIALNQYAKHIAEFVTQQTTISPKVDTSLSLIAVLGPDLALKNVGLSDLKTLRHLVYVDKTFSKAVNIKIWNRIDFHYMGSGTWEFRPNLNSSNSWCRGTLNIESKNVSLVGI
jgi:hypothetical protein